MNSSFTPRLPSSQQWTELPAEFATKVESVFANQFKVESQLGDFLIAGRIYPEEIILRVGYVEKDRLKQINFEASMDRPKATTGAAAPSETTTASGTAGEGEPEQKQTTMERLYTCIDTLGSVMEEYFELDDEDEVDVPTIWRPYEFEGETVYLRSSTINTRLEDEADRILGLLEKQLVHETATEDALAKAEIDSELAFEIQKAIRSGKYRDPRGFDAESPSEEDAH